MEIHRLFLSPGHNYFGHNAVMEVDWLECVAGRRIRGDRFFDFKENYKGQITFFSVEVLEALRRELDLSQAQASGRRRNVFVRGLELNPLIGAEFEIQGVRFAGVWQASCCVLPQLPALNSPVRSACPNIFQFSQHFLSQPPATPVEGSDEPVSRNQTRTNHEAKDARHSATKGHKQHRNQARRGRADEGLAAKEHKDRKGEPILCALSALSQ